ncbi:MAG: 2-dehydropantoate 2-reductase N-terminal domain-containing protein [Methanomassiliicoccus sp.]|nr:2-dehydropantoate 2-reductase N-terminal domain-containing protein [Methanomassiliicoccus sp.]
MEVLIVGAGIIGTVYGWAFAEGGVNVTHLVRLDRMEGLKGGVMMDVLDERKGHLKHNRTSYAMRTVTEVGPGDRYDVVIVPTNSYQLAPALAELAPKLPNATFILMSLNWVDGEYERPELPIGRYFWGYPDGGGTVRNGAYWTNLGPELHLQKEAAGSPAVTELLRSADLSGDYQENMKHWIWVHNAGSTPIWMAFLQAGNMATFLRDKRLLNQSLDATGEVLALLRKRGVRLDDYPDVAMLERNTAFIRLMMKILYRFNKSMQRYTAHALGGREEAIANYRQIMSTARELGYDMPIMGELGRALGIMEQSNPGA